MLKKSGRNIFFRINDDYSNNRALWCDTRERQRIMKIIADVTEGSVHGSEMWNVLYDDDLLQLKMPNSVFLV